jgi:hypothetical protein
MVWLSSHNRGRCEEAGAAREPEENTLTKPSECAVRADFLNTKF